MPLGGSITCSVPRSHGSEKFRAVLEYSPQSLNGRTPAPLKIFPPRPTNGRGSCTGHEACYRCNNEDIDRLEPQPSRIYPAFTSRVKQEEFAHSPTHSRTSILTYSNIRGTLQIGFFRCIGATSSRKTERMTSSNNNNSSSSNSSNSNYDPSARLHLILDRVYRSCADDPYTSVHRAWSIALVFTLVYFSLSMVESKYKNNTIMLLSTTQTRTKKECLDTFGMIFTSFRVAQLFLFLFHFFSW